MLKVWGRNTSINVQKVMWAIGELGIEYARHDVGGSFGGLDTADFRAMNPNRQIPTIEDDGVVLWESNAIVRYLASKYGAGHLWPTDPADRARADRWMDWLLTTLYPDLFKVFWGLVRTPGENRDMAAIEAAATRLGHHYGILDHHLANRDFIEGDALTIGDIPVGATCYRYFALDIARPRLPNVEAWYERLQTRAPYREHVMISFESLRAR